MKPYILIAMVLLTIQAQAFESENCIPQMKALLFSPQAELEVVKDHTIINGTITRGPHMGKSCAVSVISGYVPLTDIKLTILGPKTEVLMTTISHDKDSKDTSNLICSWVGNTLWTTRLPTAAVRSITIFPDINNTSVAFVGPENTLDAESKLVMHECTFNKVIRR